MARDDELAPLEPASAGLDAEPDAESARFADLVARQVQRRRAEQAAHAILAAEAAEAVTLPPRLTLDELLRQPDEPVAWRIEGLWPQGGRVLLPAPAKAGKSTLVGNVLRSLADGTPFLDAFTVSPVGRVLLIDDELSSRALRLWLDEQGIRNRAAVDVVSLRGRTSAFTVLEAQGRARWANYLAGVDVLVIDCLRPIMDALGLDENHDGGTITNALDELCQAAGIGELLLVHHAGHGGERSRGDSRLIDWPDAVWKLERDAPGGDEAMSQAARYFSAYGRDVDEPQRLLRLDGRRLTIAGGGRASVKASAALVDVLEVLAGNGELSGNRIETQLLEATDHSRQSIRAAIKAATESGQILTRRGERNARLHSLNPQFASSPGLAVSSPANTFPQFASSPIGRTASELRAGGDHSSTESGELNPCSLHPTQPKPEACYTCEVNSRGA